MNFKKYSFVVIILFLVGNLFSFSPSASAKLKNSPKTGYELYVVEDRPYYNKVNGKKIGVIKSKIIPKHLNMGGSGDVAPNSVKIIKFVNEYWVKVKFSNKYKGKKNIVGYVKTKHLRANLFSEDYAVSNAPILNLRKSASIKSKRLARIPRGTIMVIDQYGGYYQPTHKGDWIRVIYVEKGKKYVGYVNTEFIIE